MSIDPVIPPTGSNDARLRAVAALAAGAGIDSSGSSFSDCEPCLNTVAAAVAAATSMTAVVERCRQTARPALEPPADLVGSGEVIPGPGDPLRADHSGDRRPTPTGWRAPTGENIAHGHAPSPSSSHPDFATDGVRSPSRVQRSNRMAAGRHPLARKPS